MTIEEYKFCMESYLPEGSYERCPKCKYYGDCKSSEAHKMAISMIEELQAHREAWEKVKRTVKAYLMLEEFGVEYQDDIEKLIDGCRPKEGSTE